MSEGDEKSNPEALSWWGGWIQSAKDKSISVLNLVKQDLSEFGSVMQCDGSRVASVVREKFNQETAASASQKVKQGMTSLWGELSKALVIPPDDDGCYEVIQITDGKPITFDRVKAQLHALQIDITTYTKDPGMNDEKFKSWMEKSFDLEQVKPEISDLLVSNANIRSLYTQLVPLTVSNIDFWCRYFYKKHLLEEDENKRVALVKRAEKTDKSELTWDEDEDASLKDTHVSYNRTEELNSHMQIQTVDDIGSSLAISLENLSEQKQGNLNSEAYEIGKSPTNDGESEDLCSGFDAPSNGDQIKLEESLSGFLTVSTKVDKDNNGSVGNISNESTGESPTDDWEKVCNNDPENNKTSGNEGTHSNEDWEEW